uniref:Similar to ATMUS81 n=1 Tax=Arundo donax TaxID=35708 RepID=A0A0A8ZQD5_ARUDO
MYAVSLLIILNSADPIVLEDCCSNVPWAERGDIEAGQSGGPQLEVGPLPFRGLFVLYGSSESESQKIIPSAQ